MRTSSAHTLAVICLGHLYVNLESEQNSISIKDTATFKKRIGGLSSLVSIGLSRLGHACALLATIGRDPLGEYLRETLHANGVDTTLLIGSAHPTLVAFDHQLCSDLHAYPPLCEDAIDPAMIGHAKAILVTDEFLTDEISQRVARKAIIAAKDSHTKVILALTQSSDRLDTILPFCDLIIGSHCISEEAITHIRTLTNALLVIKPTSLEQMINHTKRFASFVTGFVDAWFNHLPLSDALLHAERHEKMGLPTHTVLQYVNTQKENTFEKIVQSPYFKHLQYISTRTYPETNKLLVNFGYHAQWQKLAEPFAASEDAVQVLKTLLADAILSTTSSETCVGIIADENPPTPLTQRTILENTLLACAVDLPDHVPLKLAFTSESTRALIKWSPRQIVKVSLQYHPDDRHSLRSEQESTMQGLYQACRETDHALIIDIAPPTNSIITASTLGHIIQRFYDLSIYPDNWQFAPPRDPRSWESIHRVITERDPECAGVLVHTPLQSLEQLGVLFDMLTRHSGCNGVVISKNVFQPLFEQWLSQKMADHVFVEQSRLLFGQIVARWKASAEKPLMTA